MQLQANGLLSFHIVWHNNERNRELCTSFIYIRRLFSPASRLLFHTEEWKFYYWANMFTLRATIIKIVIRKTFDVVIFEWKECCLLSKLTWRETYNLAASALSRSSVYGVCMKAVSSEAFFGIILSIRGSILFPQVSTSKFMNHHLCSEKLSSAFSRLPPNWNKDFPSAPPPERLTGLNKKEHQHNRIYVKHLRPFRT